MSGEAVRLWLPAFCSAPWLKPLPSLTLMFCASREGGRGQACLESPYTSGPPKALSSDFGSCTSLPTAQEWVSVHKFAMSSYFLLWKPPWVALSGLEAEEECDDFMTAHLLVLCALRVRQRCYEGLSETKEWKRTSPHFFLKVLLTKAHPSWSMEQPIFFLHPLLPDFCKGPSQPQGAPSQLSYLGAEDFKEKWE